MAEVTSGLSAAPAVSNVPMKESSEPKPTDGATNKSNPEDAESENEDWKNIRIPFSVIGHVPGFTHLISQRNPSTPDKIFASSLFASGHGYPLFYPEAMQLDDDFRDVRGISIGDVGVLTVSNQFLFLFNIFLPADHPYNKDHAPESFFPLNPLHESEICTTPNYFPRGYVIASKGVKVTRHSEDPLHLTFSSSARRGAVMVLPEGATRHDLSTTNTSVFNYVNNNAVSWTRHYQRRRYPGANGALYVVTGVDKTSVEATLAFPVRPPSVDMSATYENGEFDAMEGMSIARIALPAKNLSPHPNNLCPFMRGMRIALGRTEWIENVDERAEAHTFYTEIFVDTPRLRLSFLNTIIRFGRDEQKLSLNDKSFFNANAFHPSDIVAQAMLCMDQHDATAAFVDDSIWSIFSQAVSHRKSEVQQNALTFICSRGSSFDDLGSMFDDVFAAYDVVNIDGVLRLARTSVTRVTKDPWRTRLWFWLSGREKVRGGTIFRELFRQGQFHFKTNDQLRSRSRL